MSSSSSIIPNVNKNYLINLFSQIFSNPQSQLLRPDHRTPSQYRDLKISCLTHSFNSPINVCLGNTQIFSQINAKLVSPKVERPSEGIISFQVDTHHLKPMADFNSTNEALNEFRISINTILEKCLKESHALDTNILCVIPGKIVYKIIIEINIIKNDGNVFDAAVIAALSSWLSFKIPFFRVKNGELYYDTFINLTTIHMPVCVSFGIFEKKDEKVEFVVDNTLEEESVMKGMVSICANIFGEISYMKMNTEAMIGVDEIQDLIGEVDKHVLDIHKKIKKFVEEENIRVEKILKEGKLENDDFIRDIKENEKDFGENNNIEQLKNKIIKKMDIEENIGNNINILEFKK